MRPPESQDIKGPAGINCCSVPLTQQKQQTKTRKKNKMAQKKKNIKVRDLKPIKDAKGGRKHGPSGPRGN
jgi:hypothetical protein